MATKREKVRIFLLRPKAEIITKARHPRGVRPPYVLKYIEALLRRNKDFTLAFLDCFVDKYDFKKLINKTRHYQPHIICLYQVSFDKGFIERFILEVDKNLDTFFVLLGPGVVGMKLDSLPFKSKGNVIIMAGEAEERFIEFAEEFKNTKDYRQLIDRFSTSAPLKIEDLDKLPFPQYSSWEIRKYSFTYPLRVIKNLKWGHILSSRGCPHECIFCSPVMRESYGKESRLRSIKNIIKEIQYQKELGINVFAFDDDNFTTNKDWVISISEELIRERVNIPWIAHARIDDLDEEMLTIMKKAGCILLRLGVESGSEKIIQNLRKGESGQWRERVENIFRCARELGIGTVALFLIGSPDEDERDIIESVQLAKKINPDIIQVAFFTPYPGSSVYDTIKDKVSREKIGRFYHYSTPLINFSNISNERLCSWQSRFYKEFVLRPSFLIQHFKRFFLFYALNLGLFFGLLKSISKSIRHRVELPS